MKSYQLFRLFQRFYKEREQNTHIAVNENRKTGKLYFTTGCFIKPFKMKIIFSSIGLFAPNIFICFASLFAAQFLHFDVRMMEEMSKTEIANYNVCFKTNFNLLVISFLY